MIMKHRVIIGPITILVLSLVLGAALPTPGGAQSRDADTKAHLHLFITAEKVLSQQKQGRTLTLVDVRPAQRFEAVRIPGTIHLPLFALKTKAYLKDRPLILVGEDYRHRELIAAGESLAKQGFNIRILHGGLYGWRAAGGDLKGELTALEDLPMIAPDAFIREQGSLPWQIVDLTAVEKKEESYPGALAIIKESSGEFPGELTALAKRQKRDPFLTLLVFNGDGSAYGRINRELSRAGLKHMIYLRGGLEAQEGFLKGRTLAQRPREERLKVVSPCPTCGPEDEKIKAH